MKSNGAKLRAAANIILIVTLALALISGIYEIFAVSFWVGLITIITNGLTGLVVYILMHAFADVTDNTADAAESNRRILQMLEDKNQSGR